MLSFLIPILVIGGTVALSWPLGRYMRWAMDPAEPGPRRQRFEAISAKLFGRLVTQEQTWKTYLVSMLVFNVVMFAFVYLVLVIQHKLWLNPDGIAGMEPSLAFNTSASFTTNTNLQHYSGETGLSYFSQLFAMMWLQFVSAATGIAAVTALFRGLAGRKTMGNFFADLWRATFLLLIPLALVVATLLLVGGMPMTFDGAAVAQTLEGITQKIARGPVAAMVTIKQLGTNGGGYFGPNSTHPFENPGFWTNILENVAILVIPMATVWMFGRIIGRRREAVVVFGVMLAMFVGFIATANVTESAPTRAFSELPVADSMNLEGKELRFGATAGATWAVSTTVTSNGSVNAMHDSLNPLTGLLPMTGMWVNCVFGGVGVGFINMFVFIIVGVFIAGLMVGRTPEYLTKKIEAKEMKLAVLALLAHPLLILGGTALFAATAWGQGTHPNPGSHGFSEILYEFSSAAANNGSGFEGLGDNTVPWNIATGVVMLLARFIPIIAPLAIAGFMSMKKSSPESSGSLRTSSPLFGTVLLGTVLFVGALLFLPLAVLGPIAEFLS
jgi:K+-transporting ATPase ATPase A chain